MRGDFFISDSNRIKLPTIFRQLGLKQRDVAKGIGVSAATISRFTSNGDDRINLRSENLRKLVSFLEEQFAKCRAIKSLGNAELEERRKTDRGSVEAALSLTKNSTKVLESDIAGLLIGETSSSETAANPVFGMPGGPLMIQAKNYIARKADRDVEAILRDSVAPSSVVSGPIHGGTSSFLDRVYQRALEIGGCWARIVNFQAAFAKGETFTQLDLFRFLFRELGVTDDVLADTSFDVHDLKEAFDKWAKVEWEHPARVVILIDGLDELFRNAGASPDPLAVTYWFQALRLRAASHPYNKLALIAGFTGATWSAAHWSPFPTQAGALDLNKFSNEEVAQLFQLLGVEIDKAGVDEAHKLFHGHPYLTQLFAWSMRDGSSHQDAKEAALGLKGRYEMHWERMKSEIEFLCRPNFSVRRVLAVVAKIAAQQKPETLVESDDDIWRNYRRGLREFGLIDGAFAAPAICEFYQAAIDREQ